MRLILCPSCDGSGWLWPDVEGTWEYEPKPCPECGTSGDMIIDACEESQAHASAE